MLLAQAFQPTCFGGGRVCRRSVQNGLQCQRGIGEQLHCAASVISQLGCAVGDAQKLGLAKHGGRTIGELKVQTATHRDHQVGLPHDAAAHGRHHARMVVADQAATLTRVQIRSAQALEQGR